MKTPSSLTRRSFCQLAALGGAGALLARSPSAWAYAKGQPTLELVAESPTHLWNSIVVLPDGRKFSGMPRWQGFEQTPSVVAIQADGSLQPFPGHGWNSWTAGADRRQHFICINALNCFDGKTLWAVDQGVVPGEAAAPPGAQKLVQFDADSGKILRNLSFGTDIMPPGALFNDLRIMGDWLYATESGLGAIIVYNLKTGQVQRRLAESSTTKQVRPKLGRGNRIMVIDGKPGITNADPIELSPDGEWLYYQPASGPLYRVPTRALRDAAVSEAELETKIQYVYDTPTLGGTAIDDRGNIILGEADVPRVSVLTPDGSLRFLLEDDRLWGVDAMYITRDRYLYMPISQVPNLPYLQGEGGDTHLLKLPFQIFRVKLPDYIGAPLHA
ncbi:L-dopachrome tautomerase-related protein [Frateuria aurantia]